MSLQPGDVVLIRIDFHQTAGSKIRPAVAVLDTGDDDFVAAPITSRISKSEFDLRLSSWQAAGLNVPSAARLHKLSVLSKTDILRNVGRLSKEDLTRFAGLLCRVYCPPESPLR